MFRCISILRFQWLYNTLMWEQVLCATKKLEWAFTILGSIYWRGFRMNIFAYEYEAWKMNSRSYFHLPGKRNVFANEHVTQHYKTANVEESLSFCVLRVSVVDFTVKMRYDCRKSGSFCDNQCLVLPFYLYYNLAWNTNLSSVSPIFFLFWMSKMDFLSIGSHFCLLNSRWGLDCQQTARHNLAFYHKHSVNERINQRCAKNNIQS